MRRRAEKGLCPCRMAAFQGFHRHDALQVDRTRLVRRRGSPGSAQPRLFSMLWLMTWLCSRRGPNMMVSKSASASSPSWRLARGSRTVDAAPAASTTPKKIKGRHLHPENSWVACQWEEEGRQARPGGRTKSRSGGGTTSPRSRAPSRSTGPHSQRTPGACARWRDSPLWSQGRVPRGSACEGSGRTARRERGLTREGSIWTVDQTL